MNDLISSLSDLLKLTLQPLSEKNIRFRFSDGSVTDIKPGEEPVITVVINDERKFRDIIIPPDELSLTEGYIFNVFDFQGDYEHLIKVADRTRHADLSQFSRMKLFSAGTKVILSKTIDTAKGFFSTKKPGSVERDREAVASHYDISNDFFASWLDKRMVYSGTFATDEITDLDKAQEEKLNTICSDLDLRREMTLLDIGCGWGSFLIYAAENFGVHGTGVTLSKEQAEFASRRVAAAGLQNNITVKLSDYRDLSRDSAFDRISSIEMLHHVSKENIPGFFSICHYLLNPGGKLFLLTITGYPGKKIEPSAFGRKYFMPDYELVHPEVILNAANKAGFKLTVYDDVTSGYQYTSKKWIERLEQLYPAILDKCSEETYRIQKLGMIMMQLGFMNRDIGFYKMTFQKL
ncbi:MAG: class I SAM-dependent methyltransferase [Ignavibacteriaceae bacterium]|nr:class I SAM-dependent methyltransferase [Ignavibacteriaceae bacterium]